MRNIPTLTKADEAFIAELVRDFYDPNCPNRVCGHPASLHIDGQYNVCRYEHTEQKRETSGVNSGMLREEQKKCVCTLTPSEVRTNRIAAARAAIDQWANVKPPETKAVAEPEPSVMDEIKRGRIERGDGPYGPSWESWGTEWESQ